MSVEQRLLTEFTRQLERIWPILAQPVQRNDPPRPFHAQVLLRDDLLRIAATVGGSAGRYPAAVLELLGKLDRLVSVMRVERSERELRTELAATAVDRGGAVMRAVGRLTAYDQQQQTDHAEELRRFWWELTQHLAGLGDLRMDEREARLAMIRDTLFPERITALNEALGADYAVFAPVLMTADVTGSVLSDLQYDVNQATLALATAGGYLARSALQLYHDLQRLLDRVNGPASVATLYDLYRDSRVSLDEQFPRSIKRLRRHDQIHGTTTAVVVRDFLWRFAEAVAVEIDPPTAELQRVLQQIHDRLFGGVDAAWLRTPLMRASLAVPASALTTSAARYQRILALIRTLRGPLQRAQPAKVLDAQRAAEQALIDDLAAILQRAGRRGDGSIVREAIEFLYYVRLYIRDDHDGQPLNELIRDVNLPGRGDPTGSYEAVRSLALLLRADERDGTAYADVLRELLREFAIAVITAQGRLDDGGQAAIAEACNAIGDTAELTSLELQIMQTVRSHARLLGELVLSSLQQQDDAVTYGALLLLHDLELISRRRRVWNLQDLNRIRRLLDAAERATIYAIGPFEDEVVRRSRVTISELSNGGRPLALFFLSRQDRMHGTRDADAVTQLYEHYQAVLQGEAGVAIPAGPPDGTAVAPLLTQVYQLLAAGDDRGALGAIEAALLVETEPVSRAAILCLRADASRRLGYHDAALEDLAEARRTAPAGSVQALSAAVTSCEVLSAAGRYADVIAVASTQLQQHPEADQLLLMRAAAYRAENQLQAAIVDYRRVLDRQPTRGDIWRACGDVYAALGDTRRALADVSRALQLAGPGQSAEQVAARHLRGRLYQRLADIDGISIAARDQLLRTAREDFRLLAEDEALQPFLPAGLSAELAALDQRLGE